MGGISFLPAVICLIFFQSVLVSCSSNYDDSCTPDPTSSNDGCDLWRGMRCHPDLHKCRCYDETSMTYNAEREACYVTAQLGSCGSMEEIWWNELQCGETLVCLPTSPESGMCFCDWNYLPNDAVPPLTVANGPSCLPAFEVTPCDNATLPCHPSTGLVCLRGRCQCPHPVSQNFDSSLGKCVSILEAEDSCDPNQNYLSEARTCEINAFCGEDKKCHCNPGYSPDFSFPSSCHLHYGTTCEINYDSCNYDRGFQCLNGICGCQQGPDTKYDPDQQLCAVGEGLPCGLGRGDVTSYFPTIGWKTNMKCFTGLECKSNGTNPYVGICAKISEENNGGDDNGSGTGGQEGGSKNETGRESVILIFKMFK